VSARSAQAGFTLVELLIAVLVLGIGITALVGTSALVTRQIGRGRIVTIANQLANQKLDELRRAAAIKSGGNHCTNAAFASGSSGPTRGVSLTWTVGTAGTARNVTVVASYPVTSGTKTFQIATVVGCY
jgi:prepilin-type N-terminal cleavage/methylation domain-containing protein